MTFHATRISSGCAPKGARLLLQVSRSRYWREQLIGYASTPPRAPWRIAPRREAREAVLKVRLMVGSSNSRRRVVLPGAVASSTQLLASLL